jgi:hypothetical protein
MEIVASFSRPAAVRPRNLLRGLADHVVVFPFAAALETEGKHKVPPAYSRADECARSLTARRDDDVVNKVGRFRENSLSQHGAIGILGILRLARACTRASLRMTREKNATFRGPKGPLFHRGDQSLR